MYMIKHADRRKTYDPVKQHEECGKYEYNKDHTYDRSSCHQHAHRRNDVQI